jgi:hypothetical protein
MSQTPAISTQLIAISTAAFPSRITPDVSLTATAEHPYSGDLGVGKE